MNNKERINAVTEQLKSMQAKVFQKSQGENGEYYKGLLDGTLTEFSAPKAGVTTIAPYRFYNFSNLKKADFIGVTDIPSNICSQCTYANELIIDPNTTKISDRAFHNYGKATSAAELNRVDLVLNLPVKLEDYSLSGVATIKSIKGEFQTIGNRALGNSNEAAKSIEEFDIKINGPINAYGFDGNFYVNTFNLDKSSNVTRLDSGAFRYFGSQRNSPETNIFTFDFRNSTTNKVDSDCFMGRPAGDKSSYFNIYLPSTCNTLYSNCFSNSDHYNIYYKNVPALSNVNSFSNATNFKNFFPYELVKTAKESTNWSSTTNGIVDSIYGWAEENTFTQGQTLPITDSAGNTLTWYSDVNLTIPVTTAENPEQIYYCSWTEKVS